ncbi:hypothetical protein CBR_g6367 [Chara braunii]|uniref:Uncharacterized protein n=1 Tax=Chara braunii TaxID=69332 RepID=A0A388KJR7_CHABU|nr:hypothetical protein CBR_g6367 [Chara braunii]|eukprot:GBG70238.1 hypothetical protein CBR_g6367 [Chara braunii]
MAKNFGSSLRKISEKLDVVDKKTKAADMEWEKLVKKVLEIEGRNVKVESNSNEKRKRVVGINSTSIERSRSRSRSRSGGIKIRQPRIEVSSDDEETKKVGKGAAKCSNPSEVKLEDVMKIISVIASRGQGENPVANTNAPATDRGKRSTTENKSEGTSSAESDDERDKLKVNRGCKGKEDKTEAGIVEYMRQRLDHYMEMNGKKVKSLCVKRDIKWVRKDKCTWELAKQDTDEFSKLVHGDSEHEEDPEPDGEEDGDPSSDVNADNEDVAGQCVLCYASSDGLVGRSLLSTVRLDFYLKMRFDSVLYLPVSQGSLDGGTRIANSGTR